MVGYCVEPNPSRFQTWPGCKCKQRIEEGDLRWGSHSEDTHWSGPEGNTNWYWSHLACVSLRTFSNALLAHGSLAAIPGAVEHDLLDELQTAFVRAETAEEEKEAAKQRAREEKEAEKRRARLAKEAERQRVRDEKAAEKERAKAAKAAEKLRAREKKTEKKKKKTGNDKKVAAKAPTEKKKEDRSSKKKTGNDKKVAPKVAPTVAPTRTQPKREAKTAALAARAAKKRKTSF